MDGLYQRVQLNSVIISEVNLAKVDAKLIRQVLIFIALHMYFDQVNVINIFLKIVNMPSLKANVIVICPLETSFKDGERRDKLAMPVKVLGIKSPILRNKYKSC